MANSIIIHYRNSIFGGESEMNRILVVSSALILVATILAILLGLQELITKTTLDGQFSGFYLFGCGLFFTPIALMPFRKGERWAWYTALGAGGIALIGQLVLAYLAGSALDAIFLPAAIMLVVLWGIAIALSATQIFVKR
jgi:hypothetical protein